MNNLADAMVVSRGGVLRWRSTNEPVTPDDLVTWFEIAYPEPWTVKARRLVLATRERVQWQAENPRWNRAAGKVAS